MNGNEYILGINRIPNANLYLTYIYSITGMTINMVKTSAKYVLIVSYSSIVLFSLMCLFCSKRLTG